MKKFIFYDESLTDKNGTCEVKDEINIYYFKSIREIVKYLIDENQLFYVVLDKKNKLENNIDLIETVTQISPFVKYIIFDNEDKYKNFSGKIIKINSIEELSNITIDKTQYNRRFNRINWPLKVKASFTNTFIDSIDGKILSLSAGGAFLELDYYTNIEITTNLYLMIEFKDFKLYVDTTVVRIARNSNNNISGIAVEFHHVSKITQNCIDSIIKDRLASKLLFTIDELFE